MLHATCQVDAARTVIHPPACDPSSEPRHVAASTGFTRSALFWTADLSFSRVEQIQTARRPAG
jgi:hypothetical protein